MPTLRKAQLTESESPWLKTWDLMYQGLCLNGRAILASIGFYTRCDLPVPEINLVGNLTQDEEAELSLIATALTLAATISEAMSCATLIATLRKVAAVPSLFFSGQLPAAVEWEVAGNYQRSNEKPGMNWRDVWGEQQAVSKGQIEVPTELNIARAAKSAICRIQKGQRRGRRYNAANRILAKHLGNSFRRSGQRIVRHWRKELRRGKLVSVESGPFYDFLDMVLPPLKAHLRERGLAPVTVDTIVRLVTDDFPLPR